MDGTLRAVFYGVGHGIVLGVCVLGGDRFARALGLDYHVDGAELLRAYVFTGFPWGSPPQALIDVLSGQALAWVGPHGVMLGLCALGWFATLDAKRYLLAQAAAFALIAPVVFFPADWLAPHPVGEDRPIIRLVQPNAPQHEKWEADKRWTFVREGLDQTRAPGDPDLILWPETSIPTLLHNADTVVQALGEAAGETPVAFGILRLEESGLIANSLLVADASGQISQTYDKHHLVPFGEYMPLRRVFNAVGLRFIGDMFGDGFARGAGAQLLDFGPLGTALPLICYEAVFAHDVGSAPERPDFLIQVTNDAWFGDFAGPQQHLAQARMRAIEQGLPMARAANTGISAMIDPYGRITAFVGLNEAGFVDAPLPAPRKATLYSKTGDKPLATLLFLVAMMCLFGRIRAGAARKS